MERRLGKGLESLLSGQPDAAPSTEVPIEALSSNPFQPRKQFDDEALAELSASIRRHGVMQPIVVRQTDRGLEIVSGERRWRASKQAGLARVPIIIRANVRDNEMLELALIENLQRRDLNPIERALGFKSMLDSLRLTQEQVAERVGLKRSTVTNHLRLLELPKEVRDALEAELIDMGHAKALMGVTDVASARKLLEETIRDGLSVREVEARAQAAPRQKSPAPQIETAKVQSWIGAVERRLEDALGTRVHVRDGKDHRGSISIEYFDRDDLERLLDRLAPRATL